MSPPRYQFLIPTLCLLLASQGCAPDAANDGSVESVLRLAVTTSTRDSGLLDELIPVFETHQQARVDVIAVGTGAALKLGEAGDVDAVLVHARNAEDDFMAAGHGVRREDVMYNMFVILGPADDPADIAAMGPVQGLKQIAAGRHRFVSRGDDSGTHKREMKLWSAGGGLPKWAEFIESGQGMGATITMADQMNAYVLVDRGTYLKFKKKTRLVPLGQRSPELRNPYSAIVVKPDRDSANRGELAERFVDFLISDEAQSLIDGYRLHGEQLYHPSRLEN